MAKKIGEAFVRIRPDTRGFVGEAQPHTIDIGGSLGAGFAGAFTKAFGAISVALGSVLAAGKVVDLLKESVQAASDLGETTSAVGQIFGESADAVVQFAQKANRSLGQTRTQALNAANTFATFGKSAGLAGQDLVDFSTEMVGLSADLASFRNTTPEDAIEAIGAALRGEAEPIRRYGVLLDDATLRQRALALGIVDTTKNALTPQQRVLAAQAEILAQTADAQGDFARTSNGLANQQRITTALIEDFKVKIGELLLPAVNSAVSVFNDRFLPVIEQKVIPALGELRDFVVDRVVPVLRDDIVPVIRDDIIPAVLNFAGWIRDELIPKLEDLRLWIAEKVAPVIKDLKDNGVDTLKGSFDELKGSVEDNKKEFEGLWNVLTKIVDFVATYVTPWLGPILRQVIEGTAGAVSFLIDVWGGIIGVITGVIDKFHDLVFWLRDVKDRLIAWEHDAGEILYGAGQAVVQGFINGIRSMASNLFTTLTRFFAENVPAPVRRLLGLASPSRLFNEFGRNTIRGFIDGVEAEAGGVARALARAIPTPPQPALAGAGAGQAAGSVQNIFNLVGPSVAELAAQVAREQSWSKGA